jgi:hypothetical protein
MDTSLDSGDTAGRRKLWQLDSACRESLIGGCLSPRELKDLCRKLGVEVPSPEANEFRRALVDLSGTPSPAARRLHKYLDRKYWRTVLRFTGATSTVALAALWRETAFGEAADACWALATHPHASDWLIGRVHREVQDGPRPGSHAVRVDDRTLQRLMRADQAFAGQRETAGAAAATRLSTFGGVPDQRTRSAAEDRNLRRPHAATDDMQSRLLRLRIQVEDYAAKLALERVRAERAEASAREWRQRAIRFAERHRPRGAAARAAVCRVQSPHAKTDALIADRELHVPGTG